MLRNNVSGPAPAGSAMLQPCSRLRPAARRRPKTPYLNYFAQINSNTVLYYTILN